MTHPLTVRPANVVNLALEGDLERISSGKKYMYNRRHIKFGE